MRILGGMISHAHHPGTGPVIGVCDAGAAEGAAFVRCLKRAGFRGTVVGLGYGHHAIAGDVSALIPRTERGWECFAGRLIDARNRFGMEALVVATATETPLIARFGQRLADARIPTSLPCRAMVGLRAPEKLSILATRLGAPAPATYHIRSHHDLFLAWSRCAKPLSIMSSSGPAFRARRFDEAAFLFEEIAASHGLPVMLRSDAAPKSRVAGVGNGEGGVVALAVRGSAIPEEELRYVSENFASATRWRGVFELGFESRDGVPSLGQASPLWSLDTLESDDGPRLALALTHLLTGRVARQTTAEALTA